MLRDELTAGPRPATFLTMFMMGMISPWIDGRFSGFGKHHLFGAREVAGDVAEHSGEKRTTTLPSLTVDSYTYWEMCCAFLAEPAEIAQLNTPVLHDYIQMVRTDYHPIVGFFHGPVLRAKQSCTVLSTVAKCWMVVNMT